MTKEKFNQQEKEINEKLSSLGYTFGNVFEDGITQFFEKEKGEKVLTFSYHWENQGAESFIVGRLNYSFPLNKLEPGPILEIDRILVKNLDKLPLYEDMILTAIVEMEYKEKTRKLFEE